MAGCLMEGKRYEKTKGSHNSFGTCPGKENSMNQIGTIIMLVVMSVLGGGSTLFLLLSLPAVLIWKIYRKVRYGFKLTD